MEGKGELGDLLSSWGGEDGDTHTLTWNTVILEFQGAVVSTYFHGPVYRAIINSMSEHVNIVEITNKNLTATD